MDDLARGVAAAIATADRFWQALATDQDEELARVLSSSALESQPRSAGYPGLAAAFRDGWGLSADLIQQTNLIDIVGLVEGGGFRVRRTLHWTGPYEAGEPIDAWPVDVLPDGEGGWVVDPIRPFPRKETGQVQFRVDGLAD